MADYDVPPVNVPIKDFIYDGYLKTVAVPLVKWFKESRGFTLSKWPSSGEYYNFFFTYWYNLVRRIEELLDEEKGEHLLDRREGSSSLASMFEGASGSDKPGHRSSRRMRGDGDRYKGTIKDKMEFVRRVGIALRRIRNRSVVTPGMFFFAFLNSLYVVRKYSNEESMVTYSDMESILRHFEPNTGVDEIEEFIVEVGNTFRNLAPFLSKNGLFGLNTYLYLFFNNIHPVSFSTSQYIVHGSIENPVEVSLHDLQHICDLSGLIDVPSFCRGTGLNFSSEDEDLSDFLPQGMTKRDYRQKLKEVYMDVLEMASDKRLDKKMKSLIFVLFVFTHESSFPIGIPLLEGYIADFKPETVKLLRLDRDFLPILLDLVEPEEFGIPKDLLVSLDETDRVATKLADEYLRLAPAKLTIEFLHDYGRHIYGEYFHQVEKHIEDMKLSVGSIVASLRRR